MSNPPLISPPVIASPPNIPASKSHRWVLRLMILTFALGLLFLGVAVYGITSYVRLGSDERALRNGLLGAAAGHWDRKLELNVGTFTIDIVQAGLAFTRLEPEAKKALNCLRAGEVGIYELEDRAGGVDRAAMLSAADKAMEGRGWDRLVGVVNPDNLVAVYLPRKALRSGDLKVCVAVIDEGRLVVASARSDLEPLMDIIQAESQGHWKHGVPMHLSKFISRTGGPERGLTLDGCVSH